MQNLINFLTAKFPQTEVFASVDKDYICVRHTTGSSNFGKNDNNAPVIVPITNTVKYHQDTVRLMIISANKKTQNMETIDQIKNKVAKKYGYKDWYEFKGDMLSGLVSASVWINRSEEAEHLFNSQISPNDSIRAIEFLEWTRNTGWRFKKYENDSDTTWWYLKMQITDPEIVKTSKELYELFIGFKDNEAGS